jgi:dienelactone hydrolase
VPTKLQSSYHGLRAAYAFLPFLYTNRFSIAWPKITAFFTALRTAAGPSIPIGAAGYCWGGKHAINLAHGLTLPLHLAKYTDGTRTLIDCAFAAHPAGLDGDGIAEIEKIVMPLSIAIGDKDMVMGMKMVEGIRKCLDKKRESKEGKVESEVVVYPGAKHGFAVRGDPGNEREMEQGVQAEEQAVRWFAKWLVMGITQDE